MIILIIIFCGIIELVGVWGIINLITAKKKCTEYVDAFVVDFEKELDNDGNYSYYPIFEYRYEGKEYLKRSNFYSLFLNFRKGERVGLYIDPDTPEKFYCPKEKTHKIIAYLLCIAVGIFVIYVYIANK